MKSQPVPKLPLCQLPVTEFTPGLAHTFSSPKPEAGVLGFVAQGHAQCWKIGWMLRKKLSLEEQ